MRRDSGDGIISLDCSGHAVFDNEDGGDIVCAGVSALMGSLVGGLRSVVGISDLAVQEGDGLMAVSLPSSLKPEQLSGAQILLRTTVLALEEMSRYYQGFLEIECTTA